MNNDDNMVVIPRDSDSMRDALDARGDLQYRLRQIQGDLARQELEILKALVKDGHYELLNVNWNRVNKAYSY